MKIIFLLLSTLLVEICAAQDVSDLVSVRLDTITLQTFSSKKVLIYKHHSVSFLCDFDSARNELRSLSKNKYYNWIVEKMLSKISAEITQGDTAYLDQAAFDAFGYIPFDDFLCKQLETKNCLSKDLQNNFCNQIIRVHGMIKPEKIIIWYGIRYYLPGQQKYFLEDTIIVS